MSLLPSPQDCCTPCQEPINTQIPGATGATGSAGADGADGINAFCNTTADFTMPAEGANVTASVDISDWAAVGQVVFVSVGGVVGWFEVASKPNATSIELTNLEDTATGVYTDNAAPGTVFAGGAQISPAGLQGPAGVDGVSGAPTDATYITQTPDGTLSAEQALSVLGTGLMRSTTGTGVVDIVTQGVADDNVAPVDQVAGMTAGQCVFATASGIESKTAANARTALQLVKGVADTNIAPVDDAAGLTVGECLFATASGIESKTASAARTALGIGTGVGDYLLFQQQETSGTGGGGFLQPSGWQAVPLNTEVSDAGGHGSIAANKITLATGVYRVRGVVCGYGVNSFQCRLYNDSDGSAEFYGSSEYAGTDTGHSILTGRLTVTAGPKNYYVQGKCSNSEAVDGFGYPAGFGNTEVYSSLELEKEL